MSVESPERAEQLKQEETQTTEAPLLSPEDAVDTDAIEGAEEAPTSTLAEEEEERPVSLFLTTGAIFLAVAAAGWMCAGIFRGGLARGVAIIGALIGVGMVTLSYRTRRPSIIQYLALPLALIVGTGLVMPDINPGASLQDLVLEAVQTGGIAQPPIPFDPGWRFILVVLIAVLGAAAASLATGLNRPRLGIFIPVPVMFAAALIQPKDATMVSSVVALVLMLGGLALSYGAELVKEGATSGQFEIRRFARGAVVLLLVVGALVGLGRFGVLFPEPKKQQVVPPKKPEVQPPQADRVIFTVRSDRPGPWRLGVLDVYDGRAFLTPPFDTERLRDVPNDGVLPAAIDVKPPPEPDPTKPERFKATFKILDIEGHVIPNVANPKRVQNRRPLFALQYDPRTQSFRLPEKRASFGMTYIVDAPNSPSGAELATAGPPPETMKEFLEIPDPPPEVATLLAEAPANQWDKLQYVRNAFYQKVIAAGAGNPADVPPSKVVAMLGGGDATPYEITAAEVLLARWSGVPARMGYGYYAGEKKTPTSNEWEVRPRHGSTWLEAYFDGYGWVPIIGVPPKAKASTDPNEKNQNPDVRPTEELALIVYVPIRLQTIQLLYEVIRYYLKIIIPAIALLLFVYAMFPGLIKMFRRMRRRRWAERRGPSVRIATAYAEFRDVANDLNVGLPALTVLQFLEAVEPDPEHRELAWLVTRGLWGDLTRDLRPEDAEVCEEMALSVVRRLRRAQPVITRVIGFASRASLRDPFTAEIPNMWPKWAKGGAFRRAIRAVLSKLRLIKRIRKLIPIGTALVLVLGMSGCIRDPSATRAGPDMPERVVPDALQNYSFQREEKVEKKFLEVGVESLVIGSKAQVYTVRGDAGFVQGYLEVVPFKPGFGASRREVREGVLGNIGSGNFQLTRVGSERIYAMKSGEQQFYIWFPPHGRYFELLVARQTFEQADRLFAALLAYQRGEDAEALLMRSDLQQVDPRRGGED